MNQNVELDKVKVKIRALSAKTVGNGCTESEVMAAFAKIGQLLESYNLNMSEVDLRDEPCVEETYVTDRLNVTATDFVTVAISNFCDCKVWVTKPLNSFRTFHFFGMESDVSMAIYLTSLVEKSITKSAAEFKLTDVYAASKHRKADFHTFRYGMATRLSTRLNDMKEELVSEMQKRNLETQKLLGSAVTSLVLVKEKLVENEFKKLGMRLSGGKSRRFRGGEAWSNGYEAGANVNLSRPVGSSSNETKLLMRA